jgi:transposase-like protein
MANPFVLAAALARTVKITCPHCGFTKLVMRKPVSHRVCPRCKKHFPDPVAAKARRKK